MMGEEQQHWSKRVPLEAWQAEKVEKAHEQAYKKLKDADILLDGQHEKVKAQRRKCAEGEVLAHNDGL